MDQNYEPKFLEESRYFEIVDKFGTLGVEYAKGVPEAIVLDFINHCETAISSGANAMLVEINQPLFREQEINNCFRSIKRFPPEGFLKHE